MYEFVKIGESKCVLEMTYNIFDRLEHLEEGFGTDAKKLCSQNFIKSKSIIKSQKNIDNNQILDILKIAEPNKYNEALFYLDYWNKMTEINGKIDLTYSVKQLSKYMIYLTQLDVMAVLKYFECQNVSK